jgi:hypothetical protein
MRLVFEILEASEELVFGGVVRSYVCASHVGRCTMIVSAACADKETLTAYQGTQRLYATTMMGVIVAAGFGLGVALGGGQRGCGLELLCHLVALVLSSDCH